MFVAPAEQIIGANRQSQEWADDMTERGIAGCGWKRPAPSKQKPFGAALARTVIGGAPTIEVHPAPEPVSRPWRAF